jgi:hypothetical protein
VSDESDKKCPNPACGIVLDHPWLYSEPHSRPDGKRCVFVRVFRRRFTEDDICDGDIDYRDVSEEVTDCLADPCRDDSDATPVTLAVAAIDAAYCGGKYGFSSYPYFDPSGWWLHPDGSYTVDYGTGMREEPSAHLYGFTEDEAREIWQMETASA